MRVGAKEAVELTQALYKLRRVASPVVRGAFEFIAELHQARKLTQDGIEKLLKGLPALIALAKHPAMTTDRLALIVQIFANTLESHNGQEAVNNFLRMCESCPQRGETSQRAPQLPRQFADPELAALLMQLHNGRDGDWRVSAVHSLKESLQMPQ